MTYQKPTPLKVKSPNREELKVLFGAIYQHLGGEEKFRETLLDFYVRMKDDLLIGFFFDNKDIHHIAEQQSSFILNAAGLISKFEGKGPSTAHLALAPILDGHFDRRLRILEATLADYPIPADLVKKWVMFEESFRKVVVAD